MLICDAKTAGARNEILAKYNHHLSILTQGALYARYTVKAPRQMIIYLSGTGKDQSDDVSLDGNGDAAENMTSDAHFGNFDVALEPEIVAIALRYYNTGFRAGENDIRMRYNALMNPSQ